MTFSGRQWFDNNPQKPLEQKIREAVQYYTQRHKLVINTCRVNPCMVDRLQVVDGIKIVPDPAVIPNHFWLGRQLEDVCAQTSEADHVLRIA